MKATHLILILGLLANSATWLSALAGPEAVSSDSELGRLQGRWLGRAGARRQIRVLLEIRGRQVDASISTPHGLRFEVRGEVKLDASTSPRKLDWVKFAGADQQEFPQIPAIYRIDGDRFTVCNGGFNGARPTEFKSGDGVLAEVVVFERVRETIADKPKTSWTRR